MEIRPKSISKLLSSNDTGETGGHQAGILVPKEEEILNFFPMLDKSTKNPRVPLRFKDHEGEIWKFNFIYYNNKYFGGTRNEFRLTGMTKFIRSNNLKTGDTIILNYINSCEYYIEYQRKMGKSEVEEVVQDSNRSNKIMLSHTWKVIKY